jgi:enediyne biosynthesis protein E4
MLLRIIIFTAFLATTNSYLHAQSGVSTGEARTYSSKRTVGIVDQKAPIIFEDITAKTTLASFKHVSGGSAKDYITDVASGGVAIFDYDGDQKPDVYLLNGSTFDAMRGKEKPPRAALYRNLGNWKFEDVTNKAGVGNERWGMGVAVADYNNDGHLDMYVTNYGVSRLYRNNGNGTFTDVAEQLGIARKGWSTGATFGDYDKDGRLDLFVAGYVEFDIDKLPPNPSDVRKTGSVGQNFCQFRGITVMCGPRGLKGERDTLYHQKSDGTFEDMTIKAGDIDKDKGYGFASAFVRVNEDDFLDLVVVNDSTPKQLYINQGDGTFKEVGYESGIALNEMGREQAGMGLGFGDYDNDSLIDFYITNFSDDTNTLYRNEGDGNFTDVTTQAGHGEPTIPFLGWGANFLDYDNDCWKDLLIVNGHVYPIVDNHPWGTSYAQQLLLFRNNGKGRFERVSAAPESGLAKAIQGRGLAIGDLDGDGRLDAIINNIDSSPTVLRNINEQKNANWLSISLVGDTAKKSPKDAIGTSVYLTIDKVRQRMDVVSGGSYISQNDLCLHFGLGNATKIDKLEIKWPSGNTETVNISEVNKVITIVEGKGTKK